MKISKETNFMKCLSVILVCFLIFSCQRAETKVWVYDSPGELGGSASRTIFFDDWIVVVYDGGDLLIAESVDDISKGDPLTRFNLFSDAVFLAKLDGSRQYAGEVRDLFKNGFEDFRVYEKGGKEIYFEGQWYMVSDNIGKQFIVVDGEKRDLVKNTNNATHLIVK